MTEWMQARGFQDVWRALHQPMKIPPAMLRSPQFQGALRRVVNGAPQAIVTRTATIHSVGGLKANLDYTSRKGALELEGRDGERIVGREEAHAVAEDWRRDQHGAQENVCLAYAFVASASPGSPYEPVFEAASVSFRETIGEKTDYVLARHDDEPHPHCHVTIRAQCDDGLQWKPAPRDLFELRDRFAERLRERGVEIDASPRWARGVATRPLKRPVRWLQHAHLVGAAPEPRYVRRDIVEAFAIAGGDDAADRPWEQRIKATREAVRTGYLQIAERLETLDDDRSKALAQEVRAFVLEMAPPLTRREQRVEVARSIQAERRHSRDRRPDDLVRSR